MSKERLKILLAEDDLNLGVLLVDYLETEGFDVKLCKDGEQALKAFQTYAFDLCLLDVMMPKLNGFSLANEIHLLNKQMPFLFITAKSLKEDKLRGYGLGADDYITKPFDEEELIWKIKAILRRIPEQKSGVIPEISLGKYVFDRRNQSLTLNSKVKRITKKESDILTYLSEHTKSCCKTGRTAKRPLGGKRLFFR